MKRFLLFLGAALICAAPTCAQTLRIAGLNTNASTCVLVGPTTSVYRISAKVWNLSTNYVFGGVSTGCTYSVVLPGATNSVNGPIRLCPQGTVGDYFELLPLPSGRTIQSNFYFKIPHASGSDGQTNYLGVTEVTR